MQQQNENCIPTANEYIPHAFSINVIDYGAKGNATHDDTQAFQNAIDYCHNIGGGVVRVPAGQYLIATHLYLKENVTIEGVWHAPPTNSRHDKISTEGVLKGKKPYGGSVLLAVEGEGNPEGTPFITMQNNTTVKGLSIYYPEQGRDNSVIEFPWTFRTEKGYNQSLINLLLINPYMAVDFGTHETQRHYVSGVFGSPIYKGIEVDQGYDIGRITNVHFWPFWDEMPEAVKEYTYNKGIAFSFARTDWQYVDNCFAIFYHIGFNFVDGRLPGGYGGGGNVLLDKCGGDICHYAMVVEQSQVHSGVSVSNSNLFGTVKITPTNVGPVKFTGCSFFGTDVSNTWTKTGCVKTASQNVVMFGNCTFTRLSPEHRDKPYVIAEEGRISINGCTFMDECVDVEQGVDHIVLKPSVRSARIIGNEFYNPMLITNNAKGAVLIEHNIGDTAAIEI
ncbi:hypothetical protein JD969_07630 [Planctomycetota bacterium]|nr:hypothetical protein JD969_07630 [Planctomycetota bacterium]